MGSIKIILRKNKPNKELKLPLCIQIIKDRKKSIIHLGQFIDAKDWDDVKQKVKKSHPSHKELNNFILKKQTEVNGRFLEFETQNADLSPQAIKHSLKAKNRSTFIGQAELYLENLKKSGKYNRYSADKPRINRFKEFIDGNDMSFQEITESFLNRFRAYLKGTRNISERTIVNHLVVIRSIFNQAIKDNIIDQKYYPFGKGKIRIKFPESTKISLSINEVKKLEEIQLEIGSSIDHARNLWLLSFYFAGMRVSDLLRLKWADINDGRLSYKMGKNDKAGSFKIPEKAIKILNFYEISNELQSEFIFRNLDTIANQSDLFKVQQRISSSTRAIDDSLHKLATMLEINKKLTMHIARHTFGNLSGDKIPIQMLQKLYRHTSILTTIGYQANFINKDTDEALNSVLDY